MQKSMSLTLMQPKISGCQSQNARLVHLLRSIRYCWHQLGKTVDVSIHLVPTMFLHHIAGLPTVTETETKVRFHIYGT
jgi:hypothetical protein